MRHRDDDVSAAAGSLPGEQRRQHLRDGAERARGEVGDLHGRPRRSGVGEHAGPALVVEIVAGALLVAAAAPEAGDRAVDGPLGHVPGPDPETCRHARPPRLEDHVRPGQQRPQERGLRRQLAHDRLLPRVERVEPSRSRVPHRVAARLLDPHDARAEAQQLRRGEGSRQIAAEVDDEQPLEWRLHPARRYHYPSSALGERSTGSEEKRRQILDAAVRVFAHKGFHTCRVGDIAEEAGVAHGLLYHYFTSKDEVLEAVFRENWSVLVDRIESVEASDEPAREQLRHVTAILLRTWLHQPDVVRVVVREIARSPELQQRIGELVKPIEAIRRIIEHGQRTGEFRSDLDPRLAGDDLLRRHRRDPHRLGARHGSRRRTTTSPRPSARSSTSSAPASPPHLPRRPSARRAARRTSRRRRSRRR